MDEEPIDLAYRVTDADIDDAVRAWRAHAPEPLRALIDAEPYDGDAPDPE